MELTCSYCIESVPFNSPISDLMFLAESTISLNNKLFSFLSVDNAPMEFLKSVSQLDQKSMLGNYRALTGLLRSFTFYVPEDESLRIASLETLEAKLTGSLDRITQKEAAYTNQRSRIISYFDEKNGLLDRAKRAKMHVRRKYGHKSPEYKALVNKKY